MKTRSTIAQDSDLVQFRNEIRQIQADLIARDEHYRSIHEEIRRKQDDQYAALMKNIQDWQGSHPCFSPTTSGNSSTIFSRLFILEDEKKGESGIPELEKAIKREDFICIHHSGLDQDKLSQSCLPCSL
jgi:hypothetical protein